MAETVWSYVIRNTSPLLKYSGSLNGSQGSNLDPAWEQNCSLSTSAPVPTVCDLSSTHATNVTNASVSFTFYGKSVQLFGSVTGGMDYEVRLDGSVPTVRSSGQMLASVSASTTGKHNVTVIAKPSREDASLFFERAVVTVGTGLTGANVTHFIRQDDELMQYVPTPTTAWTTERFDSYGIPHLPSNATFSVLNGTLGSITIPFAGNAIFVYGTGWSNVPSTFRASVDAEDPTTLFLNSSLPDSSVSHFFDELVFFRFNLSNTFHNLTIDNSNGAGRIGLDYIEIVTVTGGSPFVPASLFSFFPSLTRSECQYHMALITVIFVVAVMFVVVPHIFRCFSRSPGDSRDAPSSASTVSEMIDTKGTGYKAVKDKLRHRKKRDGLF